jgi:putative cardiolipin synthase
LTGCTGVQRDVARLPSSAWPHPEGTALGIRFQEQLREQKGLSGFHLLVSGLEALGARASLAENAERTLDLQYFILHQDTTTKLLLQRLLRAANRGVRVRMLIDDLHAVGSDFDLVVLSSHPNIDVRAFNPFQQRGALGLSRLFEFLGDSERLNRRMHNKLWIADNAIAITGGRNLGDGYFDAHSATNFSDLDILAVGPVVRDLSASFDEFWNSESAVPIEAIVGALPEPGRLAEYERRLAEELQGFRETAYAQALRDIRRGSRLLSKPLVLETAAAAALYDKPEKAPGDTGKRSSPSPWQSRLRSLVQGAEREVLLISPYFILNERGIDSLASLVRRGVRVRVLTNSLASTDVPVAHAGYARTRHRLLDAGVELYEMRPDEPPQNGRKWRSPFSTGASLHAKGVIVDRRQVIVGSMNLDPRSRRLNTEIAVLLESEPIGADLASLFEAAVHPAESFRVVLNGTAPERTALSWIAEEDGREVRYDEEPAGFWRQVISTVLGSLAPDELL